jgi:dTDP-4-dehydrorhamnose reductase
MRILVTGVSGQIGGALVSRLKELGTVIAANRTMLDLTRPAELAERLDRIAPDIIINPAAYTAVDRAEDERELAFIINGVSPGILARWSGAKHVPFIHLSTDYVFDGSGERSWHEGDRTGPLGVYGASKLAGEVAVRAADGAHLVVRTSWVYAATGSNFLRTIARLARERPELRVVVDQIGAPTSAAMIADTLARILAMDSLPARFAAAGGMVHLAASESTSWHGFASAILRGLKERDVALATERVIAISSEDYPTKAVRPKNSRLDLARLATIFGITPPSWSTALGPELDQLAQECGNHFAHGPKGGKGLSAIYKLRAPRFGGGELSSRE